MSASEHKSEPAYNVSLDGKQLNIVASGDWSISTVESLNIKFREAFKRFEYDSVFFDVKKLTNLDTSGAYVLASAARCDHRGCVSYEVEGGGRGRGILIKLAADASMGSLLPTRRPWLEALERLGRATTRGWMEIYDTVAFFGQVLASLFKVVVRPQRVRWKSVTVLIEEVGLDALPIVMLLSFFIGCVIAFMGAQLLASFGVQIFMVDLVGLAVLREFAVLIMAIMMAARSNSAFTATIGSMKMRQEIDAMTVIGLNTDETLVAPRALACLVSAPILTFAGMVSGLIGGAVVARFVENISFNAFFVRIANEVAVDHFFVGMIKAPVFALVIAMIGCRQGLAVEGSVESLGKRTTASVVQAIFAVIVIDAIFAMFFLELGY